MKLEIFLGKVKEFFGTFHDFLETKRDAAEATGNQGRTGNIREATLNLLIPAVTRVRNFIDTWNLEKTATIKGQYQAVKFAVEELKEEDATALRLLEKTQSIYANSKYGVPENIKRAVAAHTKQNEETLALSAQLDALIGVEPEVEGFADIPQAEEVDSVFDRAQIEARQALVVQYEASIEAMEARFKQSGSHISSESSHTKAASSQSNKV